MNPHAKLAQMTGAQTDARSVGDTLHYCKNILSDTSVSPQEKAEAFESMGDLSGRMGESDKAYYFYSMSIFANPLEEAAYRKRSALVGATSFPGKTISVVISSYYRYQDLLQTVEQVRSNTFYPVQIIVVADKCDDGTVEYLKESNDKANFVGIVNERHKGNVASLITGMCHSRGDYIALIADDIKVMPGWDLEIVRCIDSDPEAGCAVPLILDGKGRVDSVGQHNAFLSTKYEWIGRIKSRDTEQVRGKSLFAYPEFQQPRECDYGIVPVLKRTCLEQIGSVDGTYYHYFFDPDLGYTLQQHGWKNIYIPTSVMIHDQNNPSTSKQINQKAAPEYYYFVHKWGLYLP